MTSPVARRFGTMRGLIRLALSWPELALGRAGIVEADPDRVRRLVFVCQGNICRSAFAEAIARNQGLNAISFGLSTGAGLPAHPPAVAAARALGVDLSAHRTQGIADYAPVPGDLLLAMETRQLRQIGIAGVPRTLLGLHARPPLPHLHDPFGLDPAYMETCLKRIAAAVLNLRAAFPGAISGE